MAENKITRQEAIIEFLREGVRIEYGADSKGEEGIFLYYLVDGEERAMAYPYLQLEPLASGYFEELLYLAALAKQRRLKQKEKK